MAEQIPDLKKLLVALAEEASHPLIDETIVNRIKTSTNTLLVISRILTTLAKTTGLISPEGLKRVIAKSTPVAKKNDAFDTTSENNGVITGTRTSFQVLDEVDAVMFDPRTRVRMPEWFTSKFWPAVLQRFARNQEPTERELEIAMYVVSRVRGEY